MLQIFKRFDVGGWRLGLNWLADVSEALVHLQERLCLKPKRSRSRARNQRQRAS